MPLQVRDSFHGVRGTVNEPIPWGPEVDRLFYQDVFVSGRHLRMEVRVPGSSPPAELEADWNSWAIGTTFFADVTPSFRPFIQLGFRKDDISIEGRSALQHIETKESDTSLLMNLGSEIDLTDNLGARIAFELDHADIGGSFLTIEPIYWCTPNIFLRGGVIGDIDATTIGFLCGGGMAF